MKKSTILILFVVTAMIFSVVASAFADGNCPSYGSIREALQTYEEALSQKNWKKAQTALAALRTAVANDIKAGGNVKLLGVVENANKAYTAAITGLDYAEYIASAFGTLDQICDTGSGSSETTSSHS